MPTYDYHCESCDEHFDTNVPADKRDKVKCPKCKKKAKRLMTTNSWHTTLTKL